MEHNEQLLKMAKLWLIHDEVQVGSNRVGDYKNSYRISPLKLCDFFDAYILELEKHMADDEIPASNFAITMPTYDTPKALWAFYEGLSVKPFKI